ncbi:cation/H(+) antiporter 18-like [Andrographis paniculata]|uniref:cation/H(+) antiporter 18-like n=1 Tax=Andrographis paniculata TaxID=175694 RepID=UPI0021E8EF02|nr:cation/H(+) antiporter 18-like [Andrographis paniculata]XP_051151269.1 cation/H(+) antiporter 18-like [Andrographis paniculata]
MAEPFECAKAPMKAASNGVFQGDNPLHFALPLLIIQICLVWMVTRALAYFLRPLRQPRVIAEMIGGILLGPSAFGRSSKFLNVIFPSESLTVLDTIANLGLLFFLFLVGLELDPKALTRTGRKALSIALAGITLPFCLGIGTSYVLRATIAKDAGQGLFLVFMGVAMSITAFPVLARILAELKLLTTDVGRMAMAAAAVNDIAAWVLLALAIALSGAKHSPLVSLWVLLSGIGFLTLCMLIGPYIFGWVARHCPEGEPVDETYICATLVAVLAAGLVTDTIGIHALFGAFVVGILVPKEGAFAAAIVEKVEDLVSGLLLPLYFVSSGLKTNIGSIEGAVSWGLLVLVIFTACFGKIFGTFVVSVLCKIPPKEALTLGFLMNTKGLVELIVLNIGKDRGVLNDQTFAILILMALATTFLTTPVVIAMYKPARVATTEYRYRTIQRKDRSTQLRLLACFHTTKSIPTLINLMEISRGTGKKGGLRVYAMHLMELSERSSAILMAHKARKNGRPFWDKDQDRHDPNQIVVAFEAFQHLCHVSIRPATAISRMAAMHEDICSGAEAKRAAMIIVPFHKHQTVAGDLEAAREDFRHVNRRVLKNAPCSVAVLVDRGLGGAAHVSASNVDYMITAVFFGGADDREAVSYGALMAEHPGVRLNVVRFVVDPKVAGKSLRLDVHGTGGGNSQSKSENEEFISEFIERASKDGSIRYEESVVGDENETVDVIKGHSRLCNLFVVGRIPEGQLAAALKKKYYECPELGPIGNLLISPAMSTAASVLVVQQYRRRLTGDALKSLNSDEDVNTSP